jgi:hypothetical protein
MQDAKFKKVYFKQKLTTELNERGEEKKIDMKFLMPSGYTKADFEYKGEAKMKNKGNGYALVTGKINNISVLDFDNKEVYREACQVYPNIKDHYHVKTRILGYFYNRYNK